jgi:hypothetical protein
MATGLKMEISENGQQFGALIPSFRALTGGFRTYRSHSESKNGQSY